MATEKKAASHNGKSNLEMRSFQMEKTTVTASVASANARQIPWSMWMREAAREKLGREKRRKAA